MKALPPESLLAEADDVLRTMPALQEFTPDNPDHIAWVGRASALAYAWDPLRAIAKFDSCAAKLSSSFARDVEPALRSVLTVLHQVRNELRLRVQGASSVSLPTGNVFQYFDEVRKLVEGANSDIFFIDPYLDSEFVSRYLTQIKPSVAVRLLTRERIASLLPAVELIRQQSGLKVEVKTAPGFHDRYVIVDKATCFQSGASFKDGAKKAPTTLTQIADAFIPVQATYEDLWSRATIK
jgi:hypothetical protein